MGSYKLSKEGDASIEAFKNKIEETWKPKEFTREFKDHGEQETNVTIFFKGVKLVSAFNAAVFCPVLICFNATPKNVVNVCIAVSIAIVGVLHLAGIRSFKKYF